MEHKMDKDYYFLTDFLQSNGFLFDELKHQNGYQSLNSVSQNDFETLLPTYLCNLYFHYKNDNVQSLNKLIHRDRSEERRVGRECRWRWGACYQEWTARDGAEAHGGRL